MRALFNKYLNRAAQIPPLNKTVHKKEVSNYAFQLVWQLVLQQ